MKNYIALIILLLFSCSEDLNDTYKVVYKSEKFKILPNGVTVTCQNCNINDLGKVGGKIYKVVDSNQLRSLINDGKDLNNVEEIFPNGELIKYSVCTSGITDLSNINSFTNQKEILGDISSWDVSQVKKLDYLFYGSKANHNLNYWDVSKVESMISTFANSTFNGFFDKWNTSSLIDMNRTFYRSNLGSNSKIGTWNVSKVTNMVETFQEATFNQDISKWNVSSVIYMSSMFWGSSFNSPIGDWNVSSVESMRGMFTGSQFNQPINKWNVSNVKSMYGMFAAWNKQGILIRPSFNSDISSWNIKKVETFELMFANNNVFNQNLSKWEICKSRNTINFSFGTDNWKLPKPIFIDC